MRRDPIFPYDVTELLAAKLAENRRPPDGKLHPSGDLTGSLRHCQLAAAGAPVLDGDLVSEVNLAVGTAMHSFFEDIFRGKPVMLEVKLDQWLPAGWSGTADWVAWDSERRAFVLGDLKTCKPGGIHYIHSGGVKESHLWQVSVYWHALRQMGIPLLNGFCVYYLPKNQLLAREGSPVMPTMQEGTPLPWDVVEARMIERKTAVDAYLASLTNGADRADLGNYLTDALAPVQSREVKQFLNKTLKRPVIDVKLAPNWSTEFCPFPNELCNCRQQGTNKIGHWDQQDDGTLAYVPRKDQEQPEVIDPPDAALIKRLMEAIEAQEKETP